MTKKFLLLIFSIFLLFSCRPSDRTEKTEEVIVLPPLNDITEGAKKYVDSLLTRMTLEERVGQCLMPSLLSSRDASTLQQMRRFVEDYHVGGIVLMRGDTASARQLAEIGKSGEIPLFIAIDAEWGLGMRLEDAPVYPKNGRISPDTEESILYDYGRQIAEECRESGINMVLGPVVDINSGNGSVIGLRSFGGNPEKVSNYGVAYAKGLESGGVVSVAKHFPGHGSTVADSHRRAVSLNRDLLSLDSMDLKPFREYVNAGLSGVMAGHIKADALDPDGLPATVSFSMLKNLLRDDMNFKGLVLTDAFDMGGAEGFTAIDALKAGADIILCPRKVPIEFDELIMTIKNSDLDLQIINDRCRRILFYKYLFGILR